jgi:uncharacterized membrane protein
MEKSAYRITSIDLLRGLVMIVMALDHVRDYFHEGAMLQDPMDLQTTTPALFLTRWITHYCAPIFVFLSGTSAYLSSLRKTKAEFGNFMIMRGLWLLLAEVTIVSFGWTFNPHFNSMVLQVIWAIGASMVVFGILCRLPYIWILVIAIVIICGHNMLDYISTAHQGLKGFVWDALHNGHFNFYPINQAQTHGFIVVYPVLPWIGIMMAGYALGKIFEAGFPEKRRRNFLLVMGSSLIALFILLRLLDGYGDRLHWQTQRNFLFTLFDMVDVSKYPPSLAFTCMTLGPAMLALAFAENMRNSFARIIMVFGRVPFFYYVLHIYFIHIVTVMLFYASGYGSEQISSPGSFFNFRPPSFGYSLGVTYLIWLGVVVALYFPCRWYDKYKSSHKKWWLSYV